jgi:hypothetical protein
MYEAGGQHTVLRRIEVSYVEAREEEGKLRKMVEILSEGVNACLKQKGCVQKDSALSSKGEASWL